MTESAALAALQDLIATTPAALEPADLEPVDVAVLDTGVDSSHPDLQPHIASAHRIDVIDDVPRAVDVGLNVNNDTQGHGTGVASVIAQLAPHARIHDIQVMGRTASGTAAAMLEGFRFAIEQNWRVINLSLAVSSRFAQELLPLCERAYYKNLIVVAARRNMPLKDQGFPAEYASVISVGNRDYPTPFDFDYRPGHVIEYMAHGVAWKVAAPGGGFTEMTGTSFATPTVASIVARLVGRQPGLKPFEVKSLLRAYGGELPE
jgi:subtilisin